ncbi:hypothetical protein GCM10010232_34920 [Streptomyces amakusaensis]|uniref:Alpha/beta hydrolase n=1 Tax=Streptomyces amakusaensis TaxID=67271 RepID=A0ABW0AG39_9ACTN
MTGTGAGTRAGRPGAGSRAERVLRTALRTAAGTLSTVCAGASLAARHAFELYHPQAAPPGRTPADKGLPVRDLRITTTRDRVTLKAWAVPADGPHTVVLCHGMGRTRSMVLGHIKLLHEAGHHVVAYDMRNHGESGRERKYGSMSDRYTGDLADVIAAVRADPELNRGELAVISFSFSTWVALHVLDRLPVPLAAVICDSGPMDDTAGGLRHFARLRRSTLPERLREGVGFAVYRDLFARICLHMLAVRNWPPKLDGVPTRLMFIAGGEDPVVPAAQVLAVAARYPRAERWTAPNALHMNAVRFDAEEYRTRVLGFLAEAFTAAAGAGNTKEAQGHG